MFVRIHMNGRAYDYNLGRFLSVDPFVQEPGNSQSMNPYSYIMNNPLSGTDPSGYISISQSTSSSGGGELWDKWNARFNVLAGFTNGGDAVGTHKDERVTKREIAALGGQKQLAGFDWYQNYKSNLGVVTVIPEGGAGTQRKDGEFRYNATNTKLGQTNIFGSFNKESKEAIKSSLSSAKKRLRLAKAALKSGDYSAVKKHYGPKNIKNLDKSVKLLLARISGDLEILSKIGVGEFSNHKNIKDIDNQFYAEVTPSECCDIALALLYWRGSDEDRTGTIIHEVSHFERVGRVRTRDTSNGYPKEEFSEDANHPFNSAYRYEDFIMDFGSEK